MTDSIHVDVWSDIACPWCYIGKRRFERAVDEFNATGQRPVTVEYHSFELSPDTPVDFEGSEVDFLAEHKGIPTDQVEKMLAHVTSIAADTGLAYNFDSLRHTRTLLAHQLLHFAKAEGKQAPMVERLMRAYFTEGRHLGRIDTLVELAGEIGLDPDRVRQALTDETYRTDVRRDFQRAAALGIQGVPFFVIDDKYGVSGAQETATFVDVLEQVHAAGEEAS